MQKKRGARMSRTARRPGAPAPPARPGRAAARAGAKPTASQDGRSASRRIDERIRELGDWRGETLRRVRAVIRAAAPEIVEEWKWVKPTNPGVPVWSHNGIVCTGETYKDVVKLTFPKGASLEDTGRLFNASLGGSARRAIDIRQGEKIREAALARLVREAVALNGARKPAGAPAKRAGKKPALLSGGNPQIEKGDGDGPVQAYIRAMPGWKRDIGRRLDALIARAVPNVRKAVRWNSPFYGIEGQGWFASFHVFNRYVKVTFFKGTSLRPVPPGGTDKEARWIDVHEDGLDEAQMTAWVKQAAAVPGWISRA
jgi:hypothetical protein